MQVIRTVSLVASLLAASASIADAQTPKRGGTLNFAVVAEPPNYDCHASTTFALIHPIAPHYSTLLKFDGAKYPAKCVGYKKSTGKPWYFTEVLEVQRLEKLPEGLER